MNINKIVSSGLFCKNRIKRYKLIHAKVNSTRLGMTVKDAKNDTDKFQKLPQTRPISYPKSLRNSIKLD